MRKLFTKMMIAGFVAAITTNMNVARAAEGWPANYGGVMLQAFYWNSFDDSKWTVLESQADELASAFDLVWIPQSGSCGGQSMGYDDLYWFSNYSSSFGNKRELKSMINTFKSKGIKTIADVVINHRKNSSNWVDFPKETYNGVTYEMLSTDICRNDDGGKAATEAKKLGLEVSQNADTGEDWPGMRDLDHKSENVQNIVKAYLNFLLNDLGYSGFRYDMVKGYSPSFTGIYNKSSNPEFSVGECWDGTSTIRNWIEGTAVNDTIQSAAFDFQFKYVVRNATEKNNWVYLSMQNDGNWPLVSNRYNSGKYRRYAVTFVENHDTQLRTDGSSNGPLNKDTLAANAYLLAMPGTPCVFLPHWQKYSTEIKAMIAARKYCGITNTSSYVNVMNKKGCYADAVDDRLMVVMGDVSLLTADATQWVRVLSGYHYAYYFARSMNTVWADLPSGSYKGEQKIALTAVTTQPDAQLCYSINDGATVQADSSTVVTIPVGETSLKVWLSTSPESVLQRNYSVKEKDEVLPVVIPSFCTVGEGETCAFFEAPANWRGTVKCWAWDDKGNYTSGSWPGVACAKLGQSYRGQDVWKWSWNGQFKAGVTGATASVPAQVIFSNNGSPQTKDLKFVNGGYYTEDGLQGNASLAVETLKTDAKAGKGTLYNLNGQRVGSSQKKGIYVVNGKKVVRN